MTDIYYQKACCWFYRSASGCNTAGGCTKAFLDTHHGDVSRVMGPNGLPKQNTTADAVNDFNTETASLTSFGIEAGVLPGLIARISDCFSEVTSVSPNTVILDKWAGQCDSYYITHNGTNTVIYLDDGNLYAPSMTMFVKGTAGGIADGIYPVVSINSSAVEIEDGMAVNNAQGNLYFAPATAAGVNVIIGGAYNDVQDVLNLTDAVYHDQWIFFNEELAPATTTSGTAYWIYSSHDGEAANNTKLYIVGYHTHAYDGLPDGLGYFPEGTQNVGTHYKTALERAKNLSDAAIKADLPTASTKNLPGDSDHIFRLYTSTENIQFMGIYFQTNRSCRPIIADNESTGSLFVKHCVGGHAEYDTTPGNLAGRCVCLNDATTGGGIFDSFFKGVEMFNGTPPSTDHSGDWEFAYNVAIHTGTINPEYSGSIIHHNLFMKSNWGVSVVSRSYQNVHNNIFYLCKMAAFHMNGAEARLRAWNNIVVMDETSADFYGLLRISTGGTVDYLDYNCICNQNGQAISVFAYDSGLNSTYNLDTLKKGAHDIEQNPQFIDPTNWDFRLRANSPCLNAGRPDLQGNPTTIGPFAPIEKPIGLYGKHNSLYGI